MHLKVMSNVRSRKKVYDEGAQLEVSEAEMSRRDSVFMYQGLHNVRSRKMEKNVFRWTLCFSK